MSIDHLIHMGRPPLIASQRCELRPGSPARGNKRAAWPVGPASMNGEVRDEEAIARITRARSGWPVWRAARVGSDRVPGTWQPCCNHAESSTRLDCRICRTGTAVRDPDLGLLHRL